MHAKLLALVMVLLCACGGSAVAPPQPQPEPFRPGGAPGGRPWTTCSAGLSVRDKIAQLVMPWIPGTYAAYDAEAFARMQSGWTRSTSAA